MVFEIVAESNVQSDKIFSKYIDPEHNEGDRKLLHHSIPLHEYGNQAASVSFITNPGTVGDSNPGTGHIGGGSINTPRKIVKGRTELLGVRLGKAHSFKPASLRLISHIGRSSSILDFGGGDRRLDIPGYVNLDIVRHPLMTTVVGDGHLLPFKEDSFDIAICEASIEHCRKPWVVSEELFRVLKKGGYIYVDAAFMQPLHSYPSHYFNMTISGVETLFDKFKRLESGVQPYQMPSYTLVYVLSNYIRCVFPSVDKTTKDVEICDDRAFAKSTGGWSQLFVRTYQIVHQILSILDRRITPDKAGRMSAGVFFLGRKQ